MKNDKNLKSHKFLRVLLVFLCLCLLYIIVQLPSIEDRFSLPNNILIIGVRSSADIGLYKYNKYLNIFTRMTDHDTLIYDAAWSQDGKTIALISSDINKKEYFLSLLNQKNGKIDILFEKEILGYDISEASTIAWSPKNDAVLVSVDAKNNCFYLVYVDLEKNQSYVLDNHFCNEEGNKITSIDISWSPNSYPVIGVVYNYQFSKIGQIYIFDNSLSSITWIDNGAYPIWSQNEENFSYYCWKNESSISSLCQYSVQNKSNQVLIDRFYGQGYVLDSQNIAILFIDAGGENDPNYFARIDITSGEKQRIRKLWAGETCIFCPDWIDGKIIGAKE